MSVPLLVLIPVALLLLVMLLCFVGCQALLGLDDKAFTDVGDNSSRCSANPSLVAYWRLDEPALSTQVKNLKDANTHKGDVKNVATAPALFPCPAVTVAANVHGAAAPGDLTLGQSGIVPGDTQGGIANNPLVPCMQVDGGFVSVPYDAALNPAAFTVEVWVQVDKNATQGVSRSVVDARDVDQSGNGFGFALVINDNNQWEAWLGLGPAKFLMATGPAITPGMTNYLAATFDGIKTLTLYVDGDVAQTKDLPMNATYHPNAKQALFIGAGGPWLPARTQPQPEPPFHYPLFPFKGKIEDVGLYNMALTDIATHYMTGNGCSVTP